MISFLFQVLCLVLIATEIKTSNSLNCSYHETVIDSIYQCGPQGLALGYAKPRCEKLSALQLSDSGCQNCIQSQVIFDWILLSEQCFQSELLVLAQSQNAKQFPDPPDCQRFETDALEILKSCYLETVLFCHLKDSILESDLGVVLDAIAINSYYKSAVTKQVREVVSSCNSPRSSSLANKIAPATEGVLLCVSFASRNGLTDDGLTAILASKLNQSSSDFVIADYDPQLSVTCRRTSEPHWSVGSADYFVVHWTLAKGAEKSALTRCQAAGQCIVDREKHLIYFTLTRLTTSFCGNGLREAGESCDLFVYTGMTGHGCDSNCHTISGYECTKERLQQSSCSLTFCGDGRRTSDEECDGGPESSVGCHPKFCTIQDGYRCQTPYNATSHCSEPALSSQASDSLPELTSSPLQSTEEHPTTNTSRKQATPTSHILPTHASTQASDTLPEATSSPLQSIKAKPSSTITPLNPYFIVGVAGPILLLILGITTLAACIFCLSVLYGFERSSLKGTDRYSRDTANELAPEKKFKYEFPYSPDQIV